MGQARHMPALRQVAAAIRAHRLSRAVERFPSRGCASDSRCQQITGPKQGPRSWTSLDLAPRRCMMPAQNQARYRDEVSR